MKTRAEDSQGEKSHSTANTFSQKEQTSEPGFQLADNRPETIAQKKLQGMISNSQQSRQTTQLQALITNNPVAPLQRKPLNKGVLNVVGENHDTSDEFRSWENEYTKEITGGAYWQEDEFKINIPKPDGKVGETVSVSGDPKILQMANAIQFHTKALSDIVKFLSRLKDLKATKFNLESSRTKVFGNLKLIQNHLPKLKAFGELHKKLKPEALLELADRPDLKLVCDTYIDFGDSFYNVFVAGVDKWATTTSALNEDTANEGELNLAAGAGTGFIDTGNALLVKMFEKIDVSPQEHDEFKSSVILERSKEMHKAGTIGKATKGVWKIGNQHVTDIKDDVLDNAQPGYELMTEVEFYEDFDKWLATNQDYQNMKKMEAKE